MKFTPSKQKVCELCGDLFWPHERNQRCCDKIHHRPCPICGSPVPIRYKSDRNKCCSKSCTIQLRKQNNMAKWGVDNPAKSDAVKEKERQVNLERYGVTTPFLMPDFVDKRKQTSLAKYGTEDPMQSEYVQAKYKATCQRRYGVDSALQRPEARVAQRIAYSDTNVARAAAVQRKLNSAHITEDGIHLDSNYELIVYNYCLKHAIPVLTQVPIKYQYQDSSRVTLIDFAIFDCLVECKGSHLIQGCYDHASNMIPIAVKLDVYRNNDVVVVTDIVACDTFSTGSGLLGIDIQLFEHDSISPEQLHRLLERHQLGQVHGFVTEANLDDYIQ